PEPTGLPGGRESMAPAPPPTGRGPGPASSEGQPVRRTLIQRVLPLIFCVVPLLAAALVAAATPPDALRFYRDRVMVSPMDWLILGLGLSLFLIQMVLCWRALQWRDTGFDERPDRWLTNLAQAAEWFPMLGLIGTVAGILETFSMIAEQARISTIPVT